MVDHQSETYMTKVIENTNNGLIIKFIFLMYLVQKLAITLVGSGVHHAIRDPGSP